MLVTNDDQSPSTINKFNGAIKLPKLKLNNQPKRFRHNREPKTVDKGCPAVQVEGAPQRTPIQLKVNILVFF
jgi:chaperone required for assembly of F1-ATPase